ncbi:MAG TPA: ABC transporter substrate-binding protein [Solirubrobacterales bacterium]|nr:ABC transporter substrate-binding protein [Solirubrobacterales bacterium]
MQKVLPRKLAAIALAGLLTVLVAACGDDDDDGGGEAAGGPLSFTVGVVDPDLGSIALLEAIDVLKQDGNDIQDVEVAEPELAIEGLAQGRFQFSGETTSTALTANQQGAPVKLIGDLAGNAWSMWVSEEISACEDLDGRRFGIFSQGSVATAMVKNWVAQTCPGTEPEYLVLGDSSTRFAALQAGEIDGTALELSDSLTIDESEGLTQLVDFAEEFPELRPSTLYANAEFIESDPEATQSFIDAVNEVDQQISEDPDYLAGLIEKHLPDTEDIEGVARAYSERDLFDVTALTAESLEDTIAFFEEAGSIEPGLSPEDAADLSFVEALNQ